MNSLEAFRSARYMGLFADWQPQYAAHGIATFPVRDKRPAVRGYLKVGERTSEQLALKFSNDNTFGFACKRSRITVLDIDTPDDKVLTDALDRHGTTPLVIRSGSGNYQAWYRHNGEGRCIRPDPSKPIDILGDGFVVAPPSMGSKGQYQIIAGTLDDLDTLPILGCPDLPTNKKHNTPPLSFCPLSGSVQKSDGARNETLWRECMKMARGCHGIEQLMEKAMDCNAAYYKPLPAEEVLKIVASAWGYEVEGKNWFGHGARIIFAVDEVDNLLKDNQDAYILLSVLKRHHWGRNFSVANGMAEDIGWRRQRLASARLHLIECGHIEELRPAMRHSPAVYRFTKRFCDHAA